MGAVCTRHVFNPLLPTESLVGGGGGRGGRLGLLLSPPGPFHSEGPPACSVPGPEEGAQPALGFLLGNVLKMVRGRGAQLQGPFCYLKKLP